MPILATGNKRTRIRRSAENGFTALRRSAENGFTALRRSAENGFTLIELMVVIAIIGIASAVVVLNMPDSGGRVRTEAEGFAARALAARDKAIIESRDVSVWVTADGYGASRRQRGVWQPIDLRPLEPERWKPGTTAIVDATGTQRAVFDTTGAVAAPVVFTLVRSSGRATVTITGDGAIRVAS
ncbi:GspH/FimT family pseudopilin [soil metagenome]